MIDPVAFQLGPFSIHWYGIIMDTAFIIGAALAYYNAKKSGINPDHILNLILIIIPAAIIGARLYYVLFNLDYYLSDPFEIFATWHGGLAIHGGLTGGFAAGYFYARKYKLDFWKTADVIAPSIILGQSIGRWGNFINQEAFGGPVSEKFISYFPLFIQKQMLIGGQYHHPAFLYESAWNFFVFIVLIIYLKRSHFPGQIMLLYLGMYSAGRFFIEGIRTDSFMLGPFRAAQLVSLVLILLSFLIFFKQKKRWSKT